MKLCNKKMENRNYARRDSPWPQPRSIDGMVVYTTARNRAVRRPSAAQAQRPVAAPAYRPAPRRQAKKKPRVHTYVFSVAGLLLLAVAGSLLCLHPATKTVQQVGRTAAQQAAVILSPQTASADPPADPLASLPADMNAAMASQTGLSASASLINLDTGKEYDAGSYTQQYEAASTSKLVAVFDYLHQVELGKATLSQNVGGDSAQDNIMRMIVYSDNDAWTRMNEYLRMSGEQAYLNGLGIDATIQVDNMQFSTPSMAKLLQLLYQGKLMNADHQSMIYNYMAHTTVTNLIQAALPSSATVYHKYGQVDGVLHDASIVEYQGHRFVLVVYTNNPAGTNRLNSQQVALIHAVTAAAFQDITAS